MNKEKMINIMDIKLEGDSSFVKTFNEVGDFFQKVKEVENSDASEEEKQKYWDEYYSRKYCLEQGIG